MIAGILQKIAIQVDRAGLADKYPMERDQTNNKLINKGRHSLL